MIDVNKKLTFSNKFRYIESNDEVIIMPLSDYISEQAYTFSDCVGKDIAEGINRHLNVSEIINIILDKYTADREEVEQDVLEITLFLQSNEVLMYYD